MRTILAGTSMFWAAAATTMLWAVAASTATGQTAPGGMTSGGMASGGAVPSGTFPTGAAPRMAARDTPQGLRNPANTPPSSPAVNLSPAGARPLLKMAPRGDRPTAKSPLPSLLTMFGALGLVLGLFFLTAWAFRRGLPTGAALLPREVVEVLGRVPLAGRQQASLLRFGNKLVLVSITPGGAETISEITEPLEVDRLAGLCREANPDSSSTTFRKVFQQFAGDRSSASLLKRGARHHGAPGASDSLEDADA
jgi:flagellar biogenesis protein FliO